MVVNSYLNFVAGFAVLLQLQSGVLEKSYALGASEKVSVGPLSCL